MKFLLTDEHVKLLQSMRFCAKHTDANAAALETRPIINPGLNISESFRNPDTYRGMEYILGLEPEENMSNARRFLLDFYQAELPIALSIILRNGNFTTGLYDITELESMGLKASLNEALLRPILDVLQQDKSVNSNTMKIVRPMFSWLLSCKPYEEFISKLKETGFKETDSVMVIVKNSKDLIGDYDLSRANLKRD